MQANALGDLSDRARQQAAELANDAEVRTTPPKHLTAGQLAKDNGRDPRLEPDWNLPFNEGLKYYLA